MDLIIDTSGEKLKVVLYSKEFIAENTQTNQKHLKHLLPEIDSILNKNNCKLEDIDVFSVVTGPGSFTGIRIGVSTIKAFGCVLNNKKFIDINNLEFLGFVVTQNKSIKTDFYVIIKSTSTKYYLGVLNSKLQLKQSKLISTAELLDLQKENNLPIFSYNCDEIEGVCATNIEVSTQDYINYNEFKKANKSFVKIEEIKPIYLALSQAEEELNKRLANGN